MDRTPAAACAALHLSPPRIALLDVLGLKALVVPVRKSMSFEAKDFVEFVALGADHRLRWGTIWTLPEGPLPKAFAGIEAVHACRTPSNADALANEIARAADAMDAGTVRAAPQGTAPFSLCGWSPATREGFRESGPGLTVPRQPTGFGWLGGEILSDEAANRLWDRGFAHLVSPEDLEAAGLFEVSGFLDYAAYDACRQVGAVGDARRAFARANPLLVNAVLRDPATRAMVDAGARLRDVLDALDPGPGVDLIPLAYGERRTVPKQAIASLSGRTLIPDAPYRSQDSAVSAARDLPRDWLPTGRTEAVAFTCLCDLAMRIYKEPGQDVPEGMWRQAMAGSSGRWVEFARRVAEARGPFEGGDPTGVLDTVDILGLIGIRNRMLQHFVKDVLAPVTMTYGDGTAFRLAGHVIRGRRRYQNTDALLRFGRDALLAGMALPAYADSLRRHAEARSAIRAVIAAYPAREPAPGSRPHPGIVILSNGMRLLPKAGWTDEPAPEGYATEQEAALAGPPSWSEVTVASMESAGILGLPDAMPDRDGSPTPQVAMIVKRVHANYAVEAPGAVEAMLDAWRRVLPRRWRNLDARGLAAAFDGEAATFAEAHGIEPGSPAEAPSL